MKRTLTAASLIVLLCAGYAHADFGCYSVEEDTRAFWHFEEGDGDTLFDASVYGNHGIIIDGGGPAQFTSPAPCGMYGLSLPAGGDQFDYVTIPSSPSLNPTEYLKIECWVITGDDFVSFVGKENPGEASGYYLGVDNGQIFFRVNGGGQSGELWLYSSGFNPEVHVWKHVTAIYDSELGLMEIWIDGVRDTYRTVTPGQRIQSNDCDLNLGARGCNLMNPYAVYGKTLDEVRISGRGWPEGTLAVVQGSVSANTEPIGGVTIDLLDGSGNLMDTQPTSYDNGSYEFSAEPGNYLVELVTPLGYVPSEGYPVSVPVTLESGDRITVDFLIEQIVASTEARSKGYWKHQYKVHKSGKGHAHESEAELEHYHGEVYDHFYDRSDGNYIRIEGVTHSLGPVDLTFEDALATLSPRGNPSMFDKACSQFLATLLNLASGKLATYHQASEDGATVSQAVAYIGELLQDGDSANDEMAKDLAEYLNHNRPIPAGIVPLDEANIPYAQKMLVRASDIWPNPAFGPAHISYYVPSRSGEFVSIDVFDVEGRKVRTLDSGHKEYGLHSAAWNGDDDNGRRVAAGAYFCRLEAGEHVVTKKVTMFRQ